MGNCLRSQSVDSNTNRSRTTITPSTPGATHSQIKSNLRDYSLLDLKTVTREFSPDMILGKGGFGSVYKGRADDTHLADTLFGSRMNVAIKKLNPQSKQGHQEWKMEVNLLGRLSHPNLVELLGYCIEDPERLLVYEFMEGGSLDNHLFRKGGSAADTLPWNFRLKIAIDSAKGLAFLHTSDNQVIHRDFKASNILLDGNYNAKISDFGIAKLGPDGENTHVTTQVKGTIGYVAPEYSTTGHLSVKSDVYSFGVLLLEMMSGSRVTDDNCRQAHRNLMNWAKPLRRNYKTLKLVMDAQIDGQYSSKAAESVANLTLQCLNKKPKKRPSMEKVVLILEKINTMKVRTG